MKNQFLHFVCLLNFCAIINTNAQVSGCTDPQSNNYNPAATINDGSCAYNSTNLSLTTKTALSAPLLNESSGLTFVNGQLWTFNDSGNPNDIYRIDTATTTVLQTVKISNATNVDWEDMTSNSDYVFVGDFGNNDGSRQNLKVYRINKSDLTSTATSVTASIINFSFSDQTTFASLPNNHNFDCESMIFLNDSIHLFSKNWADLRTKHYVLPNVPGTHIAKNKETYNTGFLVTGASVQNLGVIALVGYQKTGLLPVSMCLLFDYKDNLLFNGNKRKFSLSSMLTNGQVEGVAFLNSGVGFITNEYISQSGITITAKLKRFSIASYLPARFLLTKPVASFSANQTTVCANQTIDFTNQSTNSTSWQWSFPGGNPSTSTSQNPQIQYPGSGTYSVTLIATNSGGIDTLVKTNYITVNPLPTASITAGGSTIFCQPGSVTLNANSGPGFSYQWKKNTADILGANESSYVSNLAGSYTCTFSDGCGSALSNAIDVIVNSVPSAPAIPVGSVIACKSSTNNAYSVASVNGADTYTWTVPAGATISSGQGTNSITIQFSTTAGSGNICVYGSNSCGNSPATCLAITTTSSVPATPISISGNVVNCPGSSGAVFSCLAVANATTYNWTLPANSSITSGMGTNSITVSFLSTFTSGYIKVAAANCKGSGGSRSLTLYSKPATPGVPTGPITGVCAGTSNVTYTIAPVNLATYYTWIAPTNATIVSGQGTTSVTLNFNSVFTSGSLNVSAGNACGSGNSRATTIRSISLTPGTITGPATVCPNQTGLAYSIAAVAGATTYNWTVPAGASITAGQNSTVITVNYGASPGSVKVNSGNACGNSSYKTLAVSLISSCRGAVTPREDDFNLFVFPNPSNSQFTMPRDPSMGSNVVLILRDLAGREISTFENIKPDQDFQFGSTLPTGIYVAERISGSERKFFKLIKE